MTFMRVICASMVSLAWLPAVQARECIDYGQYLNAEESLPTRFGSQRIEVSGSLGVVAEGACGGNDWGEYCNGGIDVLDVPASGPPAIVGGLELDGPVQSAAILGTYAYLAYQGVLVVDLSDPTAPSIVGSVAEPANDLTVHGSHLYVAGSGLTILDLSNPSSPAFIGHVDIAGFPNRVVVAGTVAYIADGDSGLQIVDVSNPASPKVVGSVNPPGVTRDVAVLGHYAVLAQPPVGLVIVDVTDPSVPALVSSLPLESEALGVAVAGTRAYVSCLADLRVVELADPARPVVIGSTVAPGVRLTIAGERALVATRGAVAVVDISNPVSPARIGGVDTPDLAVDVAVSGEYAYVADRFSGLKAVDVSDPSVPRIAGSVNTFGWPYGVAVSDGYAYLSSFFALGNFSEASLRIVDILNPSAPRLMGSLSTTGYGRDVAVAGDYAYLAAFDQVRVVDVSDPAMPVLVGSVRMRGHLNPGNAIALSASHAFVADGDAGLTVLDISDPAAPAIVGHAATPRLAAGIAISGKYAYLTTSDDSRLLVFNITDPTAPSMVGMVRFQSGGASQVAVSGHYAYVSTNTSHTGSLEIVDVSTPAAPVRVGAIETSSWSQGLVVRDDIVYLANAEAGLTLLPAQCQATLSMSFIVTPDVLDLAARGRWVTGILEPPPPLAAADIDVGSIRLNGTVAVDPEAPSALGDHDGDGVPDLMVKFDKEAVGLTLSEGEERDLTVTGTVGTNLFRGADRIRVIAKRSTSMRW